eukprot:COSAG01_NODE_24404_length_780_cov_1.070485_1_plen_29_part_10
MLEPHALTSGLASTHARVAVVGTVTGRLA